MKKSILLIILGIMLSGAAFAQDGNSQSSWGETDRYMNAPSMPQNNNNGDSNQPKKSLVAGTNVPRTIVQQKTAIPYPEVRSEDVTWYRKVWRTVDLREKLNHPLYFPTSELLSRKSFVQALIAGVESGEIMAYGDDDFSTLLTPADVRTKFDASGKTIVQEKLDGTGDTTIYIPGDFNWGDVRELVIVEEWFFDKRYSQMFVRVLGICPVRVYQKSFVSEDGEEISTGSQAKSALFWIYYPDARSYLAAIPCYATNNEAAAISFDDLFQKRRFSSRIIKEGTSMNNRYVDDYTRTGLESMLESQRLERELMNIEQDLWEY